MKYLSVAFVTLVGIFSSSAMAEQPISDLKLYDYKIAAGLSLGKMTQSKCVRSNGTIMPANSINDPIKIINSASFGTLADSGEAPYLRFYTLQSHLPGDGSDSIRYVIQINFGTDDKSATSVNLIVQSEVKVNEGTSLAPIIVKQWKKTDGVTCD